ncbi:MAG TPA: hypothetical protein VHJ40_00740 [Actinomycetota bacterium]|nr:hypothetical protein [Actinomycetota bacterium]
MGPEAQSEGIGAKDKVGVRMITAGDQHPGSPVFLPGDQTTIEQRHELLDALRQASPPYVQAVVALCSCSFATPLVEARPIQDFGFGSGLVAPSARRIRWDPNALEQVLAQLADGLGAMHDLGVAHGSPTLVNSLWTSGPEGPSAFWDGLNSVRVASDRAIALDIVTFLQACVWPALLEADHHSPSLFEELVHIDGENGDVLGRVASTLRTPRSDHVRGTSSATLALALGQGSPRHSSDSMRSAVETVLGVMGPLYYVENLQHAQDAGFHRSLLFAERARHRLLDEERTRVLDRRYGTELRRAQEAIRELRQWAEELQGIVRYHEQREQAAEDKAAHLQASLDSATDLAAKSEAEAAQLRAALSEAQELATRLSDEITGIQQSRAWRVMTLMWALKRGADRLPRMLAGAGRMVANREAAGKNRSAREEGLGPPPA